MPKRGVCISRRIVGKARHSDTSAPRRDNSTSMPRAWSSAQRCRSNKSFTGQRSNSQCRYAIADRRPATLDQLRHKRATDQTRRSSSPLGHTAQRRRRVFLDHVRHHGKGNASTEQHPSDKIEVHGGLLRRVQRSSATARRLLSQHPNETSRLRGSGLAANRHVSGMRSFSLRRLCATTPTCYAVVGASWIRRAGQLVGDEMGSAPSLSCCSSSRSDFTIRAVDFFTDS